MTMRERRERMKAMNCQTCCPAVRQKVNSLSFPTDTTVVCGPETLRALLSPEVLASCTSVLLSFRGCFVSVTVILFKQAYTAKINISKLRSITSYFSIFRQ